MTIKKRIFSIHEMINLRSYLYPEQHRNKAPYYNSIINKNVSKEQPLNTLNWASKKDSFKDKF